MFCYKCGQQLPDNSKFCSSCGTALTSEPQPIQNQQRYVNPVQVNQYTAPQKKSISIRNMQMDTRTIIIMGISLLMILSMIVLPMFTLGWNKSSSGGDYTISLLGDNYMAYHGVRDDIVSFSRMTFVLTLVTIVLTVAFKVLQKIKFAFFASISTVALYIIYNLFVSSTWNSGGTTYTEHVTTLGGGNVICLISSIGICVLTFLEWRKQSALKN